MDQGVSGRETAVYAILEALLKEPLGFEKLVKQLKGKVSRGTVNSYLKELVNGDKVDGERFVERTLSKVYGENHVYQIIDSKKKDAGKIVEDYRKKQEFGPQFETLIEIASTEELQEITKAILSFPQWELAESRISGRILNGENFDNQQQYSEPLSFHTAIYNICTKKLLRLLKVQGGPKEIIDIGEKLVARQPTTLFEDAIFYYYPVDVNSAIELLKYNFDKQQEGQATILEMIEHQNADFGKLYRQRYTELLGTKDFENLILEVRREIVKRSKS